MTDFNQKTHDTDVGSHGGQSRQMMEVFENQEFGSIRVLQEAGKTFFCASDVAKALGYVNPYAAVKRHCRGPLTKREGVVQKVNQHTIPLQKRSEHDIIWIRRQKSPQWCENGCLMKFFLPFASMVCI